MENGKNTLVFFGTSAICLPFLEHLHRYFHIKLIVTQPDATGRRHKETITPPVKTFAIDNKIPFEQPISLKSGSLAERITALSVDIGVVIAFGKIIPAGIFRSPIYKTVNVHFSLLPLYRGAAPVQRAIENGETKTGITIFEINRKMDSGDIWAQKEFTIEPQDTTITLWDKLSRQGAPFLVDTIHHIITGKLSRQPQDHGRAIYAPQLLKAEGHIDWHHTASQIINRFRAYQPWPGLFFYLDDTYIRVCGLEPVSSTTNYPIPAGKNPGDILEINQDGLRVVCGKGSILQISQIQPQGKKQMTPYCYSLGHTIPPSLH